MRVSVNERLELGSRPEPGVGPTVVVAARRRVELDVGRVPAAEIGPRMRRAATAAVESGGGLASRGSSRPGLPLARHAAPVQVVSSVPLPG